jgi:hypothetical protein
MNEVDHIEGWTWHGRKGDLSNTFRYSVDYLMINPEVTCKMPRLFSRNKGWLFSLHDKDHGGTPKDGKGVSWVKEILCKYDLSLNGPIYLLAQPRICGQVFNPVSFWLCYDKKERLCAVISEVTNTYGDRHSYLCHHPDSRPIISSDRLFAQKIFYVSPFQPIKGEYEFRFDVRDDKIGIWIDLKFPGGGVMANLIGKRSPLNNRKILKTLVRRPLASPRILGLIHWQALKLWLKGAKYRKRTTPPKTEVSL